MSWFYCLNKVDSWWAVLKPLHFSSREQIVSEYVNIYCLFTWFDDLLISNLSIARRISNRELQSESIEKYFFSLWFKSINVFPFSLDFIDNRVILIFSELTGSSILHHLWNFDFLIVAVEHDILLENNNILKCSVFYIG